MAERYNPLMDGLRIVPPVEPNALLQTPTLADAWSHNVQAATDWMNQQRQVSRDRGLWEGGSVFEGGHPTQAGVVDAVRQFGENALLSTSAPGFRAYHGSPHSFERFDVSKIGTGEGAQAYGHGLYLAENEGVARGYRDRLSGGTLTYAGAPLGAPGGVSLDGAIKARINQGMTPQAALKDTLATMRYMGKGDFVDEAERAWSNPDLLRYEPNPGHMYEVNINANPEHFLHWDKPLSQQSQYVRDALAKTGIKLEGKDPTGSQAWLDVVSHHGLLREGAAAPASTTLREAGIPGIRYLDAGSRTGGEGSHNAVVFDDATIEILRKYGIAGLIAGGGAAAAGSQQQ